ncbi:MAG: response regulator [Elusimicrobia bacterium]|nr:response regulator [Elusimicrobiota bacterium]
MDRAKAVAEEKPRILVADDDPGIRDVLQEMLERAGFVVELAADGAQALAQVKRGQPDLLLLDVDMPEKTGWEVVERIKSDPLLRHLPVLFLTSMTQARNKVHGLELGANDYITKPFNPRELLARVRGALRSVRAELEANPLSRLPGNPSIERELTRRIRTGEKFAVLYADLNNFKAFNDHFGFKRGDDIIRKTAQVLLGVSRPEDFLGHIGGDDFILVTLPERAEAMCRRIVAEFRKAAPTFYDAESRKKGYIEVPDRQGRLTRFPFVGLAIGIVTNERRQFDSVSQIAALGAEMKKYAKAAKSSYVYDRRVG